jgi:hypothetical protein
VRSRARRQEVTLRVDDAGPVGLDRVEVAFDDEKVVSDAGIMLLATLTQRLGIGRLVDDTVLLARDRPGAVNAGRKVLALLFSMVLGGDCIDDAQVLRSGRTVRLLGWMPAPSTLGTFLRAFTFGHVRQLERVLGECLTRAWSAGAGPGAGRLVIDVDSFIGEVFGYQKQGAGFGYTKVRGLHPIVASRAGTGEVLQIRLRKGAANTQRGMLRFTEELIARVNRAGATGIKLLRADSGFWNLKVFKRLEAAGWEYSIGIGMTKGIRALVDQIPESDWTRIEDYPQPGEAQIAETKYGARRLIVRRVRALPNTQGELFPAWFHYPFATNRADPIAVVEREHRQHAVVELVIRDLKDQALAHFPSGQFAANGAWTVIAALAHNLLRWTTIIGTQDETVPNARTTRRRLLNLPGRLTRHSNQWTLHLPARWPWREDFTTALGRIRALAPAT